jgi:hypothetical protein
MTSVLAMLYLVLFGTLAVGFYSATTTQTQIASNDEHIARSFMAAESGMDFMRYQLGRVSIPPHTPNDQVIDELYVDLQAQLNGTGNLGSTTIAKNGNTIQIPATGSIKLDGTADSRFSATITDWAGEIVCKINGMNGTITSTRAISMDFTRATRPSSVFDYAVAPKGQILMKKGTLTSVAGVDPKIATMMSAMAADPAISVTGGKITGDLSVTEDGTVQVTGGTVGTPASSIPAVILADHVHTVDPPEFPTIDTTVYRQYATNTWVDKKKVQANIIVPAGKNPKFNAGDTVQGIMYVESPNQITFNGNFNLQGFIVMAPSASNTDTISFSGSLAMTPVPNQPQFDALRAVTGVAILAPNAAVTMSGSSGGNIRGNVIVKSFNFAGAADLQVDQGTLMTLASSNNTFVMNGSKSVKFSSTGSSNVPTAGIIYSTYYKPNPISYQEVMP